MKEEYKSTILLCIDEFQRRENCKFGVNTITEDFFDACKNNASKITLDDIKKVIIECLHQDLLIQKYKNLEDTYYVKIFLTDKGKIEVASLKRSKIKTFMEKNKNFILSCAGLIAIISTIVSGIIYFFKNK